MWKLPLTIEAPLLVLGILTSLTAKLVGPRWRTPFLEKLDELAQGSMVFYASEQLVVFTVLRNHLEITSILSRMTAI
jgi:hypothetical protein